jgi:hypothetical protein
LLPLRRTCGARPVPNAAASSTGVIDVIRSTYWRSARVSDPSADAWVGALERTERVPESKARVAIAQAASGRIAAIVAIAANACDRRRPAFLGMEVETDISLLL